MRLRRHNLLDTPPDGHGRYYVRGRRRWIDIHQAARRYSATFNALRSSTSLNTTGFATYGEQFRGIHVNQTFVGVAIGAEEAGGSHGHAG